MLLGSVIACAGTLGLGKSFYGIIRSIRSREHHRQNIHSTRVPHIVDKYVIKHTLAPDEKFNHIIVREQMTSHEDPIYINTKTFMIPIGGGTSTENKIHFAFLDYKLHPSYCFVSMDKLCWSYDDKSAHVTYMSHHVAVKHFKRKYNQNIKTFSFLTPMINIVKYSSDKELYFIGSNGKNGEFIIEAVGNQLQVIDEVFPFENDILILIISLVLIASGLVIVLSASNLL
jgi:hypothetical protein